MYTCRLQSYVFLHPNRQYIFLSFNLLITSESSKITSQMAKKSKVSGDIDPHPPSNFVYAFGFDQWVAFCWLAITRGTRWRLDWHDQQNYLSVTVFLLLQHFTFSCDDYWLELYVWRDDWLWFWWLMIMIIFKLLLWAFLELLPSTNKPPRSA